MELELLIRRVVLKVVRKAYGSSPLRWIVASINTAGVTGEYNNEEGTANSNGKAPRIRLKVAFKEGVYARGGSFLPGREGSIRGGS
jgi:hypothetical protein